MEKQTIYFETRQELATLTKRQLLDVLNYIRQIKRTNN